MVGRRDRTAEGQPLRVDDDSIDWLYPFGAGRLLAIGTVDRTTTLRVWDARTLTPVGEPLHVLSESRPVWPADSADKIAAVTARGTVQVFDDAMRPLGEPIKPESGVSTFDFSDDGRIVGIAEDNGTVRLWDSRTGSPVGTPVKAADPPAKVTTMALSDNGQLLAAGSVGHSDYPLRVFDTATGATVTSMSLQYAPDVVAITPDGRTVALGNDDGTIVLRDARDGTLLGAPLTGHQGAVSDLDFSPDGTTLLSASTDRTLRLWPVPRSPDAARDALCAKITHNMSHEQWDKLAPKVGYTETCAGLPEADYTE